SLPDPPRDVTSGATVARPDLPAREGLCRNARSEDTARRVVGPAPSSAGPTTRCSGGEGLALRRHVAEVLRRTQLLAVRVGQLVIAPDERLEPDRAVRGLVAGD